MIVHKTNLCINYTYTERIDQMFVFLIQCAMVESVVLPNWSLYLLSYRPVPLLTNQTID